MKYFCTVALTSIAIVCELSAQNLTESNLPIIIINTNGQSIPDEPKIVADMGVINNNGVNHIDDSFNDYSGKVAIEIRGSSSQMFPKKQYGIELRDVNNNDLSAPLLGFPPEADWILFAPYNDKSLVRDALAYELGRAMGRYASRGKFCELVINGDYMGVYLLLENVKRDANRVDISKLTPDENFGDDVTGGYILKIDKATGNGDAGFTSAFPPLHSSGSQSVLFFYEYPSAEDITFNQQQYIQNFIGSFETALKSSTYKDLVKGYPAFIDAESFIDFFIMNEVTRNVDGYRISTFLHKEKDSKGGKLRMGPIWDFNLGFGNADYCDGWKTSGFAYEFNDVCPQDWWLVPFWWERLMEDAAFKRKLGVRWSSLRSSTFSDESIVSKVDSLSSLLNSGSQQRNFQRWPVLGTYVWPNAYIGNTYTNEIAWLENWLLQRMDWLDVQLLPAATNTGYEEHSGVVVTPNPLIDNIAIDFSTMEKSARHVQLLNSIGQQVYDVNFSPTEQKVTMSLSHLPTGVYFLVATTRETVITLKLLKK
jgi:hypothetical protein